VSGKCTAQERFPDVLLFADLSGEQIDEQRS
jgi:hypothetical protein